MNYKERLSLCREKRRALLATNFYNFETLKGILRGADTEKSDIILQVSEKTLDYLGMKTALSLARTMSEGMEFNTWIHLDHGSSLDTVFACIEGGFDSVMIDASDKSLEENIKITRSVVEHARKYEVSVEAELGYIAKLGQTVSYEATSAEEASVFVAETEIDSLAVAIGNSHGFYKDAPNLNFEALRSIRERVDCNLVLHGSSGIPEEQLQEAILSGINKINLATEIKDLFVTKIKDQLAGSDSIDIRDLFPVAIREVSALISDKLSVINNLPG